MEPINTKEGIKQRDEAREYLLKKAEEEEIIPVLESRTYCSI